MAPKQTPKPVFKTCTPFTETTWPPISQQDQDVILDLVCNLVAPLGDHRRTYTTTPSKGKQRKRAAQAVPVPAPPATTASDGPPPPPKLSNHILTGLNAITRHLERQAATNAPATLAPGTQAAPVSPVVSPPGNSTSIAILLLTHPKPSLSPAHAHLPTLLHLSTLQPQPDTAPSHAAPLASVTPARLVPLATSADARLAAALALPRVGALAILEEAPGAKALIEYVRVHVGVTKCLWLEEATKGAWKGVNVSVEVSSTST